MSGAEWGEVGRTESTVVLEARQNFSALRSRAGRSSARYALPNWSSWSEGSRSQDAQLGEILEGRLHRNVRGRGRLAQSLF